MGYLVRKADAFLREWKKKSRSKTSDNKGRKTGRKKQRRSEHLRGKIIKM